jgi:hypothetical protein
MRRLVAWGLALAGCLGCASAPEERLFEAVDAHDLRSVLERETRGLASRRIDGPDAAFSMQASARLVVPVGVRDEGWFLALDIGTESPLECWLFREQLHLAWTGQRVTENAFGLLAENFGAVQERSLRRSEARAIGDMPALAIEWIYSIEGALGVDVGHLKIHGATRSGQTLYCQHNELGYARTVERVFDEISRSLEMAERRPAPYYEELSLVSVGESPVGVVRLTMHRDAAGDTEIYSHLSLILPLAQDRVATHDTSFVQFATPDGALINEALITVENGRQHTELRLDPVGEGRWRVSGRHQARAIDEQFEADLPLTSELGLLRARRAALALDGEHAQLMLKGWGPVTPARPVDLGVEVTGRAPDGGYRARILNGEQVVRATLDESGSVREVEIPMGNVTLTGRRTFQRGRFD